ncbi:hypothetical protein RHS03_06911, partial [Rhizoctonia solani]
MDRGLAMASYYVIIVLLEMGIDIERLSRQIIAYVNDDGALFESEPHNASKLVLTLLTTLTPIPVEMAQYQVGQKVKYTAIGGGNVENSTTTGEIVEVITSPEPAGTSGNTVQASEEEPRYLIRNDNTGKETAYKADNIVEVIN